MQTEKIVDAHNRCAEILNQLDLTNSELVATLAQLLIYSGQAISKKEIDVRDMKLEDIYKEYYSNNKDNDMGLGLILNGASIMSTLIENTGNVTANKENHNGNSLSTTPQVPQESGTITD